MTHSLLDTTESLQIANLTFNEIQQRIKYRPALIVPLGALEPFGADCPLGISSLCSQALASALSSRSEILCAPVINIGCTVPFSAFSGCAGVKTRTMVNTLLDLSACWFTQGIQHIFLVDTVTENRDAIEIVQKRLQNTKRASSISTFSLQSDPKVRSFVAKRCVNEAYLRTEFGMRSLALFLSDSHAEGLDVACSQTNERKRSVPVGSVSALKTWKKRGRDPHKLIKLFPDANMSMCTTNADKEFGRELFEFILKMLVEMVENSFSTTPKAELNNVTK